MRLKIVVVVVVSVLPGDVPCSAQIKLGVHLSYAMLTNSLMTPQVLVLLLVIFLSIFCNVKHC